MIRLLVLAALVAAQNQAAPAFDVASITVSPPTLVCELDMNQLKGELRRLSWSPDGRNLHLQTADGTVKHDYIVTVLDGVISQAFGEPEWAAEYWAMKVDLAAPAPGVEPDRMRTARWPLSGNAPALRRHCLRRAALQPAACDAQRSARDRNPCAPRALPGWDRRAAKWPSLPPLPHATGAGRASK